MSRLPGNFVDMTGKKYGMWTPLEYKGGGKWLCRCDCGTERIVEGATIRYGSSTSCGCRRQPRGHRLKDGSTSYDLSGMKFGHWTVIRRAENRGRHTYWVCQCDCGNIKEVMSDNLISGKSTTCGCSWGEHHREDKCMRLYGIWRGMKRRCYNKNEKAYKAYGGRGISICDEWLHSYTAFEEWAFANGYDPDAPTRECTIDRIDVNGNYEPSNCRWISMDEQMRNTRRTKKATA